MPNRRFGVEIVPLSAISTNYNHYDYSRAKQYVIPAADIKCKRRRKMTKENTAKRLGKRKELKLMTFLLAMGTACAFFIPFIINGSGYFIFFGDFNVQQIPFYQYCHEAVRSGDIFWSWNTDLGANFIGSYSFYLLGSPFFWLTLPFPNHVVPYLMGPLLILKFSCAALTAYLFIRRFTSRSESAMIGGLLYAFSGFSVYNIFFNHFHEAIVFFPLLLLALELFISEKRRGLLICAVFICCLSNYFFFFGMVVFTVIYWFVRTLSGSFKFRFGEFLLMIFECIMGVALTAAVMFPTFIEVMQNSRVDSFISGWSAVLYGKEQIFLNVIECFFFPPDLPARPVFFPNADVKWSSLGGWLPLFGMTGTVVWLLSQKKGTWLRRLLVILIFMALIPGLNSAFSMFNTSYYARWFFMPVLMMSLATALALEDTEVDWHCAWKWCLGITLAFVAVIGFTPTIKDGKVTNIGLYTDASFIYGIFRKLGAKLGIADAGDTDTAIGNYYDLRFWVTCAIAVVSLLAVKALIPIINEKKSSVFKPIIALICVISVSYSAFFIASGQFHSYDIDDVVIEDLIEGEVELDLDEDGFARVDVYDGVDNTGLYLGLPSINFFHSIVPAGITEFYKLCGVTRTVGSRPDTTQPAIRSLLSVKYLLDPEIDSSEEFADSSGSTKMSGYTYYGTQNDYLIYKNDNYVPMGFAYKYYMDEETATASGTNRVSHMMLKALLVENDDIEYISQYLTNFTDDYYCSGHESDKLPAVFTSLSLTNDCDALRLDTVDSFKYSSSGFSATSDYTEDRVVFFSVPYSEGWTAYVNGNETRIIKANKGFMAIVVPAGECTIDFSYETPGLKSGIIVTAVAAAVMLVYLVTIMVKRRIRPATPPEYPEGERIANHRMLYEAANSEADNPTDDGLLDEIDRDSIHAYTGFNGGFMIDDSVLNDLTAADSGNPVRLSDFAAKSSDSETVSGNASGSSSDSNSYGD